MIQSAETRARQHLLVQGFTLYTCEAAVSMLMLDTKTLKDPGHAFAIEVPTGSVSFTGLLTNELEPRELVVVLQSAAVQAGTIPLVVCSTQGSLLTVGLTPNSVRNVRMQAEAALMSEPILGDVNTSDLEREVLRRKLARPIRIG